MNIIKKISLLDSLTLDRSSVIAQASWITFFALLTALGAQVQIPHQPVPFTLQTFFVILGAAFLGSRNGMYSQLLYVGVGVLGFPVFALGGFGIAKLFGPTGGYLLSFPVASLIVGYLIGKRQGYTWTLFSMFIGLFVIFTFGTLFLDMVYLKNFSQAFTSGFLIFSWWDVVKLTAAASIYNEFAKRFKKLPA